MNANLITKVLLFTLLAILVPGWTEADGMRWHTYKEGMAKAKLENKRIFLNFYADW